MYHIECMEPTAGPDYSKYKNTKETETAYFKRLLVGTKLFVPTLQSMILMQRNLLVTRGCCSRTRCKRDPVYCDTITVQELILIAVFSVSVQSIHYIHERITGCNACPLCHQLYVNLVMCTSVQKLKLISVKTH